MTAITPLDPKFGKNARNDRYNLTRSKSRPVLYSAPPVVKNSWSGLKKLQFIKRTGSVQTLLHRTKPSGAKRATFRSS